MKTKTRSDFCWLVYDCNEDATWIFLGSQSQMKEYARWYQKGNRGREITYRMKNWLVIEAVPE